jgi:anamorsin
MSFLPLTVDTTVDFETASTLKVNQKRNLLLAPPSIAAHEEKLRDLFTTFDRSATDLQMLDRLSAGFVTLSPTSYDLVLVLSDTDGARRTEVSRDVYTVVVPSMKVGAKLQFQDGCLRPTEAREATLAGLVETDGVFVKLVDQEAIVPLRLGAKKKTGVQNGVSTNHYDLGESGDGDELIDEDGLLSEDDLKRPFQPRQPTYLNLLPFRFHY